MIYKLTHEGTQGSTASALLELEEHVAIGDIIFREPDAKDTLPHRIVEVVDIIHSPEDTILSVRFCSESRVVTLYTNTFVFPALNNTVVCFENASHPYYCNLENLSPGNKINIGAHQHRIKKIIWDCRHSEKKKIVLTDSSEQLLTKLSKEQQETNMQAVYKTAECARKPTEQSFNFARDVFQKKKIQSRTERNKSLTLRARKLLNVKYTSSTRQMSRAKYKALNSLIPCLHYMFSFPGVGFVLGVAMRGAEHFMRSQYLTQDMKIIQSEATALDKMDASTHYMFENFARNIAFCYWDTLKAYQALTQAVYPAELSQTDFEDLENKLAAITALKEESKEYINFMSGIIKAMESDFAAMETMIAPAANRYQRYLQGDTKAAYFTKQRDSSPHLHSIH